MMPSVNPKPPFTSSSFASAETNASSAGSSLTTAGLSPCACALAPQAARVATKKIAAKIEEFFMTPPIATREAELEIGGGIDKGNERLFCHLLQKRRNLRDAHLPR